MYTGLPGKPAYCWTFLFQIKINQS